MKCVLIVPRLPSLSTRIAFPPQVPLGHVMVGSSLMRGGHEVVLLDGDVRKLSLRSTVRHAKDLQPDCILIGHPASTAGHPHAMQLAQSLRRELGSTPIGYGGLHPTYHASEVLAAGDVDFVITHEAERVTRDLVDGLAKGPQGAFKAPGVMSRQQLIAQPTEPIVDLDEFRPIWSGPWQLHRYRAHGMRSAVVQFSRGCPRRCSYCGQWDFWKTWRHRTVESFVSEIDELSRLGARLFWIADENWSLRQDLFLRLLEGLRSVNRGHHLIVAMESAHVIRDAAHLKLYREAGLTQLMLGLDGEDKDLLGSNPKRRADGQLASVLDKVHAAGMTSIINHFMPASGAGRPEDWDRLRACRADFYNTLQPTPHRWTSYGQRASGQIYNRDLSNWDYRMPVLARSRGEWLAKRWRAKETELRLNAPSALRAAWAMVRGRRPPAPLLARSAFWAGMVFVREVAVLIAATLTWLATYPCPRARKQPASPKRSLVVLP